MPYVILSAAHELTFFVTTQDKNPIETNWTPIEFSIGFNWSQQVLTGFNADFNRTSDGFNWSKLSLLDELGTLAPLAYAPSDFNGTPIGLKLDFNWSIETTLKTF